MENVVVRFAPSPTGMLHIGSARTALFNYIFAKKHKGKFLLRIEDTDRQRSTKEAKDAIINGLEWLGIKWDGDIVYQSSRYQRHLEIANRMIESGNAYYAYDTAEEIEKEKQFAIDNKLPYKYNPKWRDVKTFPTDIKPVIRLKVPNGKTIVKDIVRGDVEFDNNTIEDLVLVRSDGTPTYMFAVVVDDLDMNITHIIRGEDHLSNTPKQILIYKAIAHSVEIEEKIPKFAHIPLIYDIEGRKLSKRRGSVSVEWYKENGFLKEAIFNYLLHLGWNDGTEKEIYTKQEAIDIFTIEKIGKSPSRFDFVKLNNINMHYIKQLDNQDIINQSFYFIKKIASDIDAKFLARNSFTEKEYKRFMILHEELRKTDNLIKIAKNFLPFLENIQYPFDQKALDVIENNKDVVKEFLLFFSHEDFLDKDKFLQFANNKKITTSKACQVIRSVLLGKVDSFAIKFIFEAFEKEEVLTRIRFAVYHDNCK
jgi:glutamyl-tRNA synthetase